MTRRAERPVQDMTFEQYQSRRSKFYCQNDFEMDCEGFATGKANGALREAVADYLYSLSKGVPQDRAGLYRAAACALIDTHVDPQLLREAAKARSSDTKLRCLDPKPELIELWHYAFRVDIQEAEEEFALAYPNGSISGVSEPQNG